LHSTDPAPPQLYTLSLHDALPISIRKLIAAILRRRSFHVDTVANGEEALRKLAEQPYEIMLLDLMMPKVDGYTVIDRVYEQKIEDRKSTRLNSSHSQISYAVFCLK